MREEVSALTGTLQRAAENVDHVRKDAATAVTEAKTDAATKARALLTDQKSQFEAKTQQFETRARDVCEYELAQSKAARHTSKLFDLTYLLPKDWRSKK